MRNRYLVLGLSIVLALALAVPALGGPTNPVASISASVKSIANKALKKAKAAQKTANAAQAAANAAQSTANSASTAANKAQTTANGAQTTANSALTSAGKAQKAAEEAQATANAAQASANTKFDHTNFENGSPTSGSGESAIVGVGCPEGEVPSGGGFVLAGTDSNKVRVDLSSQYLNGWIVSADNIAGHGGENWELSAVAVCIG
jgi:cytoskeletal protein RodZ